MLCIAPPTMPPIEQLIIAICTCGQVTPIWWPSGGGGHKGHSCWALYALAPNLPQQYCQCNLAIGRHPNQWGPPTPKWIGGRHKGGWARGPVRWGVARRPVGGV